MKAVIAGGGIAGSVVAAALLRAGIEAVVCEARDRPGDESGYFLNFATNGQDALRAIGLDIGRELDGHPMPEMIFWNGRGRELGRVANGMVLEDGTVSACVKRPELQKVLRSEAERRGAGFVYGKRLVSAESVGDRVQARFQDGSTETGDIVVGADVVYARRRSNNKVATSSLARLTRDLVLPLVLRLTASQQSHAWIYAHHLDWEQPTMERSR